MTRILRTAPGPQFDLGVHALSAYIPQIDGLRALAVLGVLLFHVHWSGLPGGFLGVDVFFVISGWLIIGLLREQVLAQRFSWPVFLGRRVLRLAPALLLTVLLTVAVFGIVRPPALQGDLQASAWASLLAVANLWFLATTSYFADNQDAPLLHIWSLAVEEQFYLVAPLLVWWLYRRGVPERERRLWLLATVGLCVLAEVWTRLAPGQAFYLPVTRAWEFLAGGALRIGLPPGRWPRLRRAGGWAGLALLAACYHLTDERAHFPGLGALPSVLATLLILAAAGCGGMFDRLLAWAPLRGIGRISYSVYLVHWPLVCLAMTFAALYSVKVQLLVIGLSLVLGALSWALVEAPARALAGRLRWVDVGRGYVLVLGLALAAVPLLRLATTAWWADHPRALAWAEFHDARDVFHEGGCLLTADRVHAAGLSLPEPCLRLVPGRRHVLVLGDSHAANLGALLQAHLGAGVQVLRAPAIGCRPVLGSSGSADCRAWFERMLGPWLQAHAGRIDELVLVGYWETGDPARLAETVRRALPLVRQVTVVGPWPDYLSRVPGLLAWGEILGTDLAPRLMRRERQALVDALRAEVPAPARYVDAWRGVCTPRCEPSDDEGRPLYIDRNHLSIAGVQRLLGQAWPEPAAGR
ncbi:MAG: hypothetical protein RLY78_1766 [Pseudomonadota bacterium]